MRVTTRWSKVALFAVLGLLVSGLTPVAVASGAGPGPVWTRVAGADRYETAAAVSKSGFPGGASAAVVASGELFPDGLTATYLAGQVGGPVLLTGSSSLPAATLAELTRLHVSTVYVAGGTAAVSVAVADQLATLRAPNGQAVTVVRLAGADRYATAAAIATRFPKDTVGMVGGERVALLASGTGFADALSGSAAAAGAHLPLLLTKPDALSPQVLPSLASLGVSRVMVLGGTGAISAAVATQLTGAGLAVTRLGGADRVATATMIASWEVSTLGFTGDQVAIARGDEAGQGVDALSAGAFIGHGKHPLLLAASPSTLGGALSSWLGADTALTGGVVVGGPGAISDALMGGLSGISGSVAGPVGSPGPGTTPPAVLGAVTNVSATPAETSIALSWTNPSATSLTGVMVRRALGGTPPASATAGALVTDAAKPATSFTDSGLAAGTQYSYSLFAHDATPVNAAGGTVTATTTNPATAGATWDVSSVDLTLMAGTASSVAVSVYLSRPVSNLVATVSGSAQGVVSLDVSSLTPTSDGHWTAVITAQVPIAADPLYTGSMQLSDDTGALGDALPVSVTVQTPDATNIPRELSSPADSQITTLAGSPMADGEIDVEIQASVTDADASIRRIAAANNAIIIGSSTSTRIYQLRFSGMNPVELSQFSDVLDTNPDVKSAFLALLGSTASVDPVNDTKWSGQWDSPGGDNWGQKMIDAPGAWALSSGAGVKVGIIDSGFATNHDDLRANITSQEGVGDEPIHGTHVAGIACAVGNNNLGIAGIAYGCDLNLHAIKQKTEVAEMREAMNRAAGSGSRVVNISYSWNPGFDCTATYLNPEELSWLDQRAKGRDELAAGAFAHPNTLWVFAAGNGVNLKGVDARCTPQGELGQGPANVISVAAVDESGALASYSNYGSSVTVAAPGGSLDSTGHSVAGHGVLSTIPHTCTSALWWKLCSDYGYDSGTSMAAPMVTGIAAMAAGANSSVTAPQLRQCIITGAEAGGRHVQGQPFYVVNAKKTVECALAPPLGVTTFTLPDAVVAQTYTATLSATGGTAPFTWSVASGALPPGLSLSAAGGITGTPSTLGTNSFTAVVRDSTGTTANVTLTLTVVTGAGGPGGFRASSISAGAAHTCALTTGGGVKCWGANYDGQLGDGSTTDSTTPVDVVGLGSGVAAVSSGGDLTCALTTAGAVKCWGSNYHGGLGNGNILTNIMDHSATPVAVVGLGSGMASVSAGEGHTCAVTTTGAVLCWGYNLAGELGDGTTTDSAIPVDVVGLGSGMASVSAGSGHSCAVTTAGAVKCWGNNGYGQLGDGSTPSNADARSTTPVDVVGLGAGVASVSAGAGHSCALTTGGAVKCWGDNNYGELGDGTILIYHHNYPGFDYSNVYSSVPVDVVGLGSGVASVSAYDYSCAVTTAGAVKCWGLNFDYGELGDGTMIDSSSPVDVVGLGSGVATVSAGNYHSCAVTNAGAVRCWGDNFFGELGDGTTTNSNTPVDVVGLP